MRLPLILLFTVTGKADYIALTLFLSNSLFKSKSVTRIKREKKGNGLKAREMPRLKRDSNGVERIRLCAAVGDDNGIDESINVKSAEGPFCCLLA